MPPTRRPKHHTDPETIRQDSLHCHPSVGGARGYGVEFRQCAVSVHFNGEDDNQLITSLQRQKLHPSQRSVNRWSKRLADHGHLNPFEMNGNKPASVLQGHMLMMLALYRIAYPKATAAKVNAYLFACTLPGQQLRFYSESQITSAEQWLGFSRKRASTEAAQAHLPINIAKRDSFWNDPYPFGIVASIVAKKASRYRVSILIRMKWKWFDIFTLR